MDLTIRELFLHEEQALRISAERSDG